MTEERDVLVTGGTGYIDNVWHHLVQRHESESVRAFAQARDECGDSVERHKKQRAVGEQE